MNTKPATSLKMVSISKLKTLHCHRYHFWNYVLNLEQSQINLNFWYGSVLGAAWETLLLGKDWRKAMGIEDRKYRKRYKVTTEDEYEMALQYRLIEIYLMRAKHLPETERMKLKQRQVKFRVRLKQSGLVFCGTLDGLGHIDGKEYLFENKTLRQVTPATEEALQFDKQPNGYAYSRRLEKKRPYTRCCYCIFRKPAKKLRKTDTAGDYVERIRKDLIDSPGWYYRFCLFALGKHQVSEVGYDIEQEAEDLLCKYEQAIEQGRLLDPHFWPRCEKHCHDWAGCEYLPLCKHPADWQSYVGTVYQMRELRYDEEEEEVAKTTKTPRQSKGE